MEEPHEVLAFLKQKYRGNTLARMLAWKQELHNMQQSAKESAEAFASRMVILRDKCASVGYGIPEVEFVGLLLRGLRQEYEIVRTGLRLHMSDSVTVTDVLGQLLAFESGRPAVSANLESAAAPVGEALLAGGSKGKASGAGQGKFPWNCHYCGKKGHAWRACLTYLADEEAGKVRADFRPQAPGFGRHGKVVAAVCLAALDGGDGSGAARDENPAPDASLEPPAGAWYLDSGAAYHFCRERSAFHTLDESQKGYMRVASKQQHRYHGVGTVLAVSDEGVPVLLHGVRYVPDLGYNLVSLRCVDVRGCDVHTRGGVARVELDGQLLFTADLSCLDHLYTVQWQVVRDGAGAVAVECAAEIGDGGCAPPGVAAVSSMVHAEQLCAVAVDVPVQGAVQAARPRDPDLSDVLFPVSGSTVGSVLGSAALQALTASSEAVSVFDDHAAEFGFIKKEGFDDGASAPGSPIVLDSGVPSKGAMIGYSDTSWDPDLQCFTLKYVWTWEGDILLVIGQQPAGWAATVVEAEVKTINFGLVLGDWLNKVLETRGFNVSGATLISDNMAGLAMAAAGAAGTGSGSRVGLEYNPVAGDVCAAVCAHTYPYSSIVELGLGFGPLPHG